MPLLQNARHERFAQLVASGKTDVGVRPGRIQREARLSKALSEGGGKTHKELANRRKAEAEMFWHRP